MIAEVFFDSNIICCAFDLGQPDKRTICIEPTKHVLDNEITGVLCYSNSEERLQRLAPYLPSPHMLKLSSLPPSISRDKQFSQDSGYGLS